VWSINSQLPMGVLRLQEIYDRSLARTSFALVMLVIAGAMALLLGLTGIYGVISYSVSQRTREIGIRVALGAQAGSVRRMFVAHGLVLGGDGVAIGIAVAAGLMRLMSTMLFDVSPADPLTYGLVSLALIAAATLASYIPAARAMAVDPMHVLRAEPFRAHPPPHIDIVDEDLRRPPPQRRPADNANDPRPEDRCYIAASRTPRMVSCRP
jgi:putative ABC transport system permease protein